MDYVPLRSHLRLIPALVGKAERRVRQKTDLHGRNHPFCRRVCYRRIFPKPVPNPGRPDHPRVRGSDGLSFHFVDSDDDVHWQSTRRSFRNLGRNRWGCRRSGTSLGRLLYDIRYLALGVFHQYSDRSRCAARGRVGYQRDPIQGSKIHN